MAGEEAAQPFYVIQNVPDKGRGFVATIRIAKGTRILAESPFMRVSKQMLPDPSKRSKKRLHNSIMKNLSDLSDEHRQAFYSLQNNYTNGQSTEVGIARTNMMAIGPDENDEASGIFIEASHLNHACNNNAHHMWNENIEKLTVHATRDIEQGEEICISYLDERLDRFSRQAALQSTYDFVCSCSLCSLPPEQQLASDLRLREIEKLNDLASDSAKIMSKPLQALLCVRKLLQLLQKEGIADGNVPEAYANASRIAAAHGDLARARVFAERASSAGAMIGGLDSIGVERMNDLAENPAGHASLGFITTQWLSEPADVPVALEEEAFEKWLWRVNSREAVEYADLRNRAAFPSFDSLPHDDDLDLEYYDTEDGTYYGPTRHWCFLGEIVDVERFLRLRLIVKDKSGQQIQIAFHTDLRGAEVDPSLVQKGYTVAIMYAHFHHFLDMSTGIRHEDPDNLRIFPQSLDALLRLSDQVQAYTRLQNEGGICHGCNQETQVLKKCAKCSVLGYCDKDCQAHGWNTKGHKADCKLLRDHNLRGLLTLDWEDFLDYHVFS